MGYEAKLDTRATPYTMVWFHKPVRAFYPTPRDVVGQDELTVSAWHTPGKELKFETNLPEFQTLKVTSAGPTKKFEFNGKEVATVDFDSSSKKATHTMHLPSGKDLTIDLGVGWSEQGLPGCCRQQPLDRRLQALQAGRVRASLRICLQDQVDRPWRDHQWFPEKDLSSGDQCCIQLQLQ